MKWSDIADHLPGRIGEQVKERWVNVLDPGVKRGVWSADEMRILSSAQKELGNKWSEIAKRIPGRSENSVKNRWYNQKTVSCSAFAGLNIDMSYHKISDTAALTHFRAV